MSRHSSGPGFAVEIPGYGLGISPFGSDNVTFGEQDPINLQEAQRRASLWEHRLQTGAVAGAQVGRRATERHPWGVRSESAIMPGHVGARLPTIRQIPYPNVNMIPTASDTQALQVMVEQGKDAQARETGNAQQGRVRGLSEPQTARRNAAQAPQ